MMCLMLLTMLLMTWCVAGQDTQNCQDCYTKQCVSVGDAAIHAVDRSVNPCDNFYKYACGGWLQRQFLTNERKRVWLADTDEPMGATIRLLSQGFKDGDPDAVKKAKNMFKSCQNSVYGHGETITNIMTDLFGEWPLGCFTCNLSINNLERSLIAMTRLGAHPLFTLTAHVNHLDYNVTAKKVKRYLHVGEPLLYFPVKHYSDLPNSKVYNTKYAAMIIASARNVISISSNPRYKLANADALKIIDVEREIARQIQENREGTTNSSLGSLNQNYGQLMNWTRYINELASTRDISLGEFTLNETIFIDHPSALTSIINYFLGLPIRTQFNYLAWRLYETLQTARINPEDKLYTFFRRGTKEEEDATFRDEPCAWFVTQTLPLAVHRLLYAEYLPQETVQKMSSMLTQIKYEFNALLASNNWLDAKAKTFIKEKIDSITAVVANYFEVMDDEYLDSYYSNVTINSTHEYIEPDFSRQVVMVKEEAFIRNFRSIRLPAKVDFDLPPQVFSAQLVNQIHEIVLSFAAMFHPWFTDQSPMAINYAGAMHTLAHQLLKSVDPKGMRFHRNGSEGLWISPAAKTAYDKRVRCFFDQYLQYQTLSGPEPLSAGHDFVIADNMAVKLAYTAYRNYTTTATTKRYNIGYSGFTNDKLFFIRAAQLLCNKGHDEPILDEPFQQPTLSELRVNVPLMNSLEFAFVFKCPCKTPMNPDPKCEMW